jgi:hypothetical protein
MGNILARILGVSLPLGILCTLLGACVCLEGRDDAIAAQHQQTVVGRIVNVSHRSKDGYDFTYVFSVNGVKFNDTSGGCRTPLAPGACFHNGPVLVYYSDQPHHMTRLEDFGVASVRCLRGGMVFMVIGLLLLIVATIRMVLGRMSPENNFKGASKSGDVPDVIHIVPGE